MPGAGQQNGAWGLLGWEIADGAEVGKHVQAGAAALGLAKRRVGHCGAISAPSSISTLHSWGQASFPVPCSAHGIHPTAQWGLGQEGVELFLQHSQHCLTGAEQQPRLFLSGLPWGPQCPPWDLGAEHCSSPISQPSSSWDLASQGPQPSLTGNGGALDHLIYIKMQRLDGSQGRSRSMSQPAPQHGFH